MPVVGRRNDRVFLPDPPKTAGGAPPAEERAPELVIPLGTRRRVTRSLVVLPSPPLVADAPLVEERAPKLILPSTERRFGRAVLPDVYRPLRRAPTTIITVDAAANTGSMQASSNLTFSATTGSGPNRILLVSLHNRAPFSHPPADLVTWNGQSLTFHGRAVVQTDHSIELWYLINPAPSTTANVSADFLDSRSTVGAAQHFANVHQTTPLGTIGQGGSNVGTPTATTVTAAPGDMLLSFIQRIISENVTPPGDMTEVFDVWSGSEVKGAAAYEPSDGNRRTSWGYTTSAHWTVLAVDLNPAPAVSGDRVPRLIQMLTNRPPRTGSVFLARIRYQPMLAKVPPRSKVLSGNRVLPQTGWLTIPEPGRQAPAPPPSERVPRLIQIRAVRVPEPRQGRMWLSRIPRLFIPPVIPRFLPRMIQLGSPRLRQKIRKLWLWRGDRRRELVLVQPSFEFTIGGFNLYATFASNEIEIHASFGGEPTIYATFASDDIDIRPAFAGELEIVATAASDEIELR
jgi:hypothetical protein